MQLKIVGQETVVDEDEVPTFDVFWLVWPRERRVCKKEARDAWNRIGPEVRPRVIEALLLWRRVWEKSGEWQFVPHPHRWLRNERYEDEPPVEMTKSHASHSDAKLPEPGQRSVMPQSVRDAIAKLKK